MLVRPKLFLKCRLCEIRVNNYMKHCLEFWRANHEIQPLLSPYAMIQYMLSYVTKTQKGMSAIMDRTCRDAWQGNKDIKASVRHGKCIPEWCRNTSTRSCLSSPTITHNHNEQRSCFSSYISSR